jgi:two-component system LytT family response regulator
MNGAAELIRVLVVDDEAPARDRLVDLLAEDRDVGEVLQAQDGFEAVDVIQAKRPDVVFLDVQMPGVDGLGVIDAVGIKNMPITVFVTGFDRFALQAFEADAIDYLLKPFTYARFREAMDRLKRRLREARTGGAADLNSFGPELLELAARRSRPGEIWRWIPVRNRRGTCLLETEEVDWIKAAGIYVALHVGEGEYLYRSTLADVASHLDPFQFVRVHRSSIVNVKSIALLERRSHAEFEIALKSGKRLMLSRNYRAGFEAILGHSL